VGSLDSSIRSAARATSSAYKGLPIRWRLAGGSAALTLVILCGFAVIVGILTTRQIHDDFRREVAASADRLEHQARLELRYDRDQNPVVREVPGTIDLTDFAASSGAAIRVVTVDDLVGFATAKAPDFGPPLVRRVQVQVPLQGSQPWALQYARRISDIQDTANRVKVFLAFGVLGGALLALLAGLATARRAMEPIAELTAAARRIEHSRDPSERMAHPEAEDEVSELARTLEAMLAALDAARGETEASLARQREFVADASHELRTPLTSVLANLELLEEELSGEQREAAASALRSSRRMRRLVADLLLLARADAGRVAPHLPVDLSEIVTDAASELEPVAGGHEISISAPSGARVDGARDELHRLVLNLMENALRHTDPGTAVEATVERRNGEVVLAVEDDGPGIPLDQREKVFERFYRGSGEHSGSSGLGLSIVRAVAESHGGSVRVESPTTTEASIARGTRFVVTLPAAEQPAKV
jgi:two-component system OmpR family sensor kinase